MGEREWRKLEPWQLRWPGRKQGRWWKRYLSKVRRRKGRMEARGLQDRTGNKAESTCGYKTW